MSQTLNSIRLMASIGEISKSESHLQDLVLKTSRCNYQIGYPFPEDPGLLTEALTDERLDIIGQSKGGEEFNRKVAETEISSDLNYAGLSNFPVSRAETHSLKVSKVFFENFYPDQPDAFKKALMNARENLYGHLQSGLDDKGMPREGRQIPPTILYSMAFSDGRGVGIKEPEVEHLIKDMHNNPYIMKSMDRLMDAHDAYYASHGIAEKSKESLKLLMKGIEKKPLRALAGLAAGVVVISALSFGGGGHNPNGTMVANPVNTAIAQDAKYYPSSNQAYSAVVTVHSGQTSSQIASDLLEAVGVTPTSNAIKAMLKASNISNPDRIIENSFVDIKLPVRNLDDSQREALSKVADTVSYGGSRLMMSYRSDAESKFLNELKENRESNKGYSL